MCKAHFIHSSLNRYLDYFQRVRQAIFPTIISHYALFSYLQYKVIFLPHYTKPSFEM